MSDIRKLTTKIVEDAQKKQAHLIEEAEKEIAKKERIKKQQLEKEVAAHLARYEKELQKELSLKVSDLHVKSRNRMLAAKQQVLDELFADAKEQLQNITAEDFDAFVERKLALVQLTGTVELVFGSKSAPLVSETMIQRWQAQFESDLTIQVAKETIPNRSGVVFKQGEVEFNFIFEALLESKEEELSYQLIAFIFNQE
ncbi:V-type ATP synthase subunit E [Enterococcus sp. DIV1314a]|uniref:V-type ATP synthase subunit E n=1 Tax=Enterococcus sp. DIV1314a TaxID=2774660 RepID=UPI003F28510B